MLGGYATSHKQVLYQYDLHVYPPEFIDRSTFLRFESISGVHHCLVETDSIVGRIRRTVTVTVTVTAALGTGHWQYVRTYEKLLRRRARGDARVDDAFVRPFCRSPSIQLPPPPRLPGARRCKSGPASEDVRTPYGKLVVRTSGDLRAVRSSGHVYHSLSPIGIRASMPHVGAAHKTVGCCTTCLFGRDSASNAYNSLFISGPAELSVRPARRHQILMYHRTH